MSQNAVSKLGHELGHNLPHIGAETHPQRKRLPPQTSQSQDRRSNQKIRRPTQAYAFHISLTRALRSTVGAGAAAAVVEDCR